MVHESQPSSWILPTLSVLPKLPFSPHHSHTDRCDMREVRTSAMKFYQFEGENKQKKRLVVKQADAFNIKGSLFFVFSLPRFQAEDSQKFAVNLYLQDSSPLYLTGWFPLVCLCIPACSQKQDSTHWAKCLLCHKLAFKKLASQRKGT